MTENKIEFIWGPFLCLSAPRHGYPPVRVGKVAEPVVRDELFLDELVGLGHFRCPVCYSFRISCGMFFVTDTLVFLSHEDKLSRLRPWK